MENALSVTCQPTDAMSVYDFEDVVGGAMETALFEYWRGIVGGGEETVVNGDCAGTGFGLAGVVD